MSEKTVFCIHGLGSSKASFAALNQTSLARNNRIIAMDLAGFGERWADPVDSDPITRSAEALAREVETIGGQNATLVGHSLGGAVVLLAAKMVAGQVWGIASIEGNLIAEDCGMSRRLAVAGTIAACTAIKSKAMSEAERSENSGVGDWARDVSNVSPATLQMYSRELVALSDSGELLRQFRAERCRKLYLYGDEYVGHPVLERLAPIHAAYIRGACHINFIGDAPEACADALSQMLS